jgi:cell shape-determining protein MreD
MGLIVAIVIVPHMIHGAAVSFAEALAKLPAGVSFDRRMFVHCVIIGIGVAMLAHIVPSRFNALVKSASLRIAIFSRRLVPAVVVPILGEGCMRDRLCFESMRLERAC